MDYEISCKINLNGDTLLICRANPDADTIQECGWLSSVMDKATADSKKVMLFGQPKLYWHYNS